MAPGELLHQRSVDVKTEGTRLRVGVGGGVCVRGAIGVYFSLSRARALSLSLSYIYVYVYVYRIHVYMYI